MYALCLYVFVFNYYACIRGNLSTLYNLPFTYFLVAVHVTNCLQLLIRECIYIYIYIYIR